MFQVNAEFFVTFVTGLRKADNVLNQKQQTLNILMTT